MNQPEYEALLKRDPSAIRYIQRVSSSWRNEGYFRAVPFHVIFPTVPVLKARLAFSEAAYSAYETKGLREVDGVLMPPACRKVKDSMLGKRFSVLTTREKRVQSTIEKIERLRPEKKLERALVQIGKIVSKNHAK